jgi:hypothetical protein
MSVDQSACFPSYIFTKLLEKIFLHRPLSKVMGTEVLTDQLA